MTLRTLGAHAARLFDEVRARYLLAPDAELPPREPDADPRMVRALRLHEREHARETALRVKEGRR